MTFNGNKVNLPRLVMIKPRDKSKIRNMKRKESLLFHGMLKWNYLVHTGFQHTKYCIRQYRYFSRWLVF